MIAAHQQPFLQLLPPQPILPQGKRRGMAGRRKAEWLGRDAEDQAAELLVNRGYTILARRLRTGAGEIDLVAADAETLVFIEVKARASFVEAAYSISARQQARLLGAASLALSMHEHWLRPNIRFDAALVAGGAVQIIEDAIRYS